MSRAEPGRFDKVATSVVRASRRALSRVPPTVWLAIGCASFMSLAALPARALDLSAMWDFEHPDVSEQRFADALRSARGDDALVLRTQIARTHGLRGDFATARSQLKAIEGPVRHAGAEARARWWLEMGRTRSSAVHAAATQDDAAKAEARADFGRAAAIAHTAHLDAIEVDALHMAAFVDTAPADQLRWDRRALAVVQASAQPDAQRWAPSILNNIGYALHEQGRYDEALDTFNVALVLRERAMAAARAAKPASASAVVDEPTRGAQWMVAWTLRSLGRDDEALAMQLQVERECDAAGAPDHSVYEELETLYRARGDSAAAAHYATLKDATPP